MAKKTKEEVFEKVLVQAKSFKKLCHKLYV